MARVIEQAGVSVAPTGSTGVQVNEFEAAIKSVTSATTIGAVFVYDTRNDSDGGAWRKKCAGLSWYDETLNTATRGGRREFPSVALIVADNAAGSETITIYDLDDVAAPMWLVFQMGGASESSRNFSGRSGENANSLFALNGRVMWGINADLSSGGFCIADFASDEGRRYTALASYTETGRFLSERNSAILPQRISGDLIVSGTVNDVSATYLEGSELDSLGLVRPVVACATDGGVSVIHPNGDVYDIRPSSTTYAYSNNVAFTEDNRIVFSADASSNLNVPRLMYNQPIPYADDLTLDWGTTNAADKDFAVVAGFVPNVAISGAGISKRIVGNNFDAFASANGLSIAKRNTGNFAESLVANIASDYNTGYMLGDIRGAFLMGDRTADRSVKGNTLTLYQASGSDTVDAEKVDGASGTADLYGYKSFSASNYLSRASDTDFDFGTGDFSIMLWCKSSTTGSTNDFIARGDVTPEAGDFFIRKNSSEKIQLFRHTGTSYQSPISASSSSIGTSWSQVVVTRSGTTVSIYVDGKREVSDTWADTFTPSGGSAFTIGLRLSDTSVTGQHMSLSLVRLSATAPTPQQVKDIYEAEAPLFRAGAKCLLAANQVNDLAYDSSTNLLHVASESTSSSKSFRGLEAVESLTSDGSFGLAASKPLDYVAASGGVVAGVGGDTSDADTSGCGVNLPPLDVRGDINTADSKLPDDGKLHFSGVTTDATVTTIGQIPVAANEVCNVKVRVNGCKYNASDSSYRLNGEINQSFSRNMTGNVVEESEGMKLVESDAASTDIDLVADTSAQTIQIKVTGISATRMVWKATVEVQRITERSYER